MNYLKLNLLFLFITFSLNAQIVQVKDIWPESNGGGTNASPRELFDYNGTLFFRANDGSSLNKGLWKSDGTPEGTVFVKNVDWSTVGIYFGYNFTPFNSNLFFTGGSTTFNNGTNDVELWKTDGTTQGTVRVKDINPANGASSNPNNLTVLNSTTMLFQANDGAAGMELWKTDGTNEGTISVTDFPGNANGISWIKTLGGNAIMGQSIYYELGQNPNRIGKEIYKTNGSVGNNVLVKEIRPTIKNGVEKFAVNALGTIFFLGDDGSTGWELWKTNGTAAGTVLVKDTRPGLDSPDILRIATLGNNIFFTGTTNGSRLWKSDGTTNGTVEMTIGPGVFAFNDNSYITAANGLVYFFAANTNTADLYTTDGTVTTKLFDCNASLTFPLTLETNFVELDGYVYFAVGPNSSPQKELWRTDGTTAGTVSVASLFTPSVNPLSVSNITLSNNKIFFSGTLNDGDELMMFDPSTLKIAKNQKLNDLNIYPNPSQGIFNIDFEFIENATFSVFDLLGKKVADGEVMEKKIVTSLKSGIYILKIKYENQYYSKKIIIRE